MCWGGIRSERPERRGRGGCGGCAEGGCERSNRRGVCRSLNKRCFNRALDRHKRCYPEKLLFFTQPEKTPSRYTTSGTNSADEWRKRNCFFPPSRYTTSGTNTKPRETAFSVLFGGNRFLWRKRNYCVALLNSLNTTQRHVDTTPQRTAFPTRTISLRPLTRC